MICVNKNLIPINVSFNAKPKIYSPGLKPMPADKICFTGKASETKDKGKILIVDNFEKDKDISGDGIPDISHGQVVHKTAECISPDAVIEDLDKMHFRNTIECLNSIIKRIDNGENIKVINCSFNDNIKISDWVDKIPYNLNSHNLQEYKEDMRNLFEKPIKGNKNTKETQKKIEKLSNLVNLVNNNKATKEQLRELDDLLDPTKYSEVREDKRIEFLNKMKAIEKITKKGVKVFISAGNDGSEYFDPAFLVKGVEVVGGLDPEKKPVKHWNNNFFVTRKAPGYVAIDVAKEKKDGENIITGYKVNVLSDKNVKRKDKVNIPIEETSVGKFVGKDAGNVIAAPEDYKAILKNKYSNGDINENLNNPEYFGLTKQDMKDIKGNYTQQDKTNFLNAREKIYPLEKLGKIIELESETSKKTEDTKQLDNIKKLGAEYTDYKGYLAHKIDKNNKIVLVGYGNGTYPTCIEKGTSFASPCSGANYYNNLD